MFDAQVKGDRLLISLPLIKRLSTSGKSYLVATTKGFRETEAKIGNSNISVSVNATIENPDKPKVNLEME